MKVLLTPTNVSSQTSVMTRALRAIGVNARGLVRSQHPYFDATGLEIRSPYESSSKHFVNRRLQDILWLGHLIPAMRWAEIVHWRWGRPSAYKAFDLRALKRMKRCCFVDFCGSDVRLPSLAAQDNPYVREVWQSNFLRYQNDDIPRANQSRFAALGFHCILRHRELLAYIDKDAFQSVNLINAPVMTSEITPHYPRASCRRPIIYHCPSRRNDKGADAVQAVIEQLKARFDFDYAELHGMPRPELLERISEADIVLDQFVLGDFGNLALEAMAAGKPVVCYLKPKVAQMVPDIPIVNASQDSLLNVLTTLLHDPPLRAKLGQASREYVVKHHDAIKIAHQLQALYQEKLELHNQARQPLKHDTQRRFYSFRRRSYEDYINASVSEIVPHTQIKKIG